MHTSRDGLNQINLLDFQVSVAYIVDDRSAPRHCQLPIAGLCDSLKTTPGILVDDLVVYIL
jgi:hypothetical protein